MKKLKLNLDDIKVDSFLLVNIILNEKGTVVGNMEAPKTTQTAPTACETCNDTCTPDCNSLITCPTACNYSCDCSVNYC